MGSLKLCGYDDFSCIADRCSYSCCGSDWSVYIKPEEKEIYETEEFIKNGICEDKNCFKMKDNGDCFFLDECGLCNLIKVYGPDILCSTCALFPRIISQVGSITECTLSNACPSVVEMLDRMDTPLPFVYDGEEVPTEYIENYGIRIRDIVIDLLQFQELPFWIRVYLVYSFADLIGLASDENREKIMLDFSDPENISARGRGLVSVNVSLPLCIKLSQYLSGIINANYAEKTNSPSFIKDYYGFELDNDMDGLCAKRPSFNTVFSRKLGLLENVSVNYAFRQMRVDEPTELKKKSAVFLALVSLVTHTAFLEYTNKGTITDLFMYDVIAYYSRALEHNMANATGFMQTLSDEHSFGKGNFFILCKNLEML